MIVIRDDILIVTIASCREGAQMRAKVRFVDTTLGLQSSYARPMPPAEYGVWLHALIGATGEEQHIRLRLDDGVITGIGNHVDEQWFDVCERPTRSPPRARTRRGSTARCGTSTPIEHRTGIGPWTARRGWTTT
jgi:hypothetical protein